MLDLSKPVQTRDGHEVRIYETNAPGVYPIQGAIVTSDEEWKITEWGKYGEYYEYGKSHDLDLVNVPKPVRCGYMNVYTLNGRENFTVHSAELETELFASWLAHLKDAAMVRHCIPVEVREEE